MEIFKQIAPLKAFLSESKCQRKSVGLVPTMGALHDGHIALVKASRSANQITVSSIFVNPVQFNNPIDLQHYPRNLEKDTELLASVGCDVLFCPEESEMYPTKATLSMEFGDLNSIMEGQFRPGHFSGVAIVVSKLFNIIRPDHAYFGQKDWQQFALISRLNEELNFGVTLHSVPTLRESNGLALSSRNQRLTEEQRAKASVFYESLRAARHALNEGKKTREARIIVRSIVEGQQGVRLEYFEMVDSKNFKSLEYVEQSKQPILCIAGYVGEVRLIDNMFLDDPSDSRMVTSQKSELSA